MSFHTVAIKGLTFVGKIQLEMRFLESSLWWQLLNPYRCHMQGSDQTMTSKTWMSNPPAKGRSLSHISDRFCMPANQAGEHSKEAQMIWSIRIAILDYCRTKRLESCGPCIKRSTT